MSFTSISIDYERNMIMAQIAIDYKRNMIMGQIWLDYTRVQTQCLEKDCQSIIDKNLKKKHKLRRNSVMIQIYSIFKKKDPNLITCIVAISVLGECLKNAYEL